MKKQRYAAFADRKLESDFETLANGTFQDRKLYKMINNAMVRIKNNPLCGFKIQRDRWPKYYSIKYGITNLFKYNLSDSWRLIYTVKGDEVMIVSIVLEWFDHKTYNKRFNY